MVHASEYAQVNITFYNVYFAYVGAVKQLPPSKSCKFNNILIFICEGR